MAQLEALPPKRIHHSKDGVHIFVNPYWGGKFVTDDQGALVIEMMDHENDEDRLVQQIADRLNINPYEAAARLVAFTEQLYKRRMLGQAEGFSPDNPKPDFGFLEVTRKCDTRCRLCYVDSGRELPDTLTAEEIYKTIDQMAELGVENIALTGGDPLTRADLPDILDYIRKQKGLRPAISTSLLSLTRELAQKMAELDVAVQISLDGCTPETNDWNRGQGSFEKTMAGIQLLNEHGVVFRFAFVINKHNLPDIKEMVALGIELGAREVAFGKVKLAGRAAALNEAVVPSTEEMIGAYHQLYRCDFDVKNSGLKVRCKHNQALLAGLDNRVGCLPCGAGRTFVHVTYNGDVIPCSLFNGCRDFTLGNVHHDRLTDLWQSSPIFRYFRQTTADDIGACRDCPVKYLCGGGCRADAYLGAGSTDAVCSDCEDLLAYYNWILDRGCQAKYITAF